MTVYKVDNVILELNDRVINVTVLQFTDYYQAFAESKFFIGNLDFLEFLREYFDKLSNRDPLNVEISEKFKQIAAILDDVIGYLEGYANSDPDPRPWVE